MKIAVFHYHLHPGGVTRVISLACKILLSRTNGIGGIEGIEEITVVTGDRKNAEAALPEEAGGRIRIAVHPEIGYLDGNPETSARSIKTGVLEKYRGYIWWIHNYHLGKNPLLTQAVVESAAEYPDQKILLHIHDFPECSRYENLAYLKSLYPGPIYPLSPNVRYICINRRDYTFLLEAGIPSSMARVLNNPLTEEPEPPEGIISRSEGEEKPKHVKSFLEERGLKKFPGYLPGRPLLLYPVRSIRRKNVLEAGLISRLITDGVNVAVTLPGVSDQEAGYSRLVENGFAEGSIHGVFGTGAPDAPVKVGLHELIGGCDAVLSTSVQEGFGYLFVNTLQWGKKLAARRLDILEGMISLFDAEHHFFYDSLKVPRSRTQQEETKRRYGNYIGGLESYVGKDLAAKVLADMEERLDGETIDFSYLSVDEQHEVLGYAGDSGYLDSVKNLNPGTTAKLESVCCTQDGEAEPVSLPEGFGPPDFARAFREILDSFEGGGSEPADSPAGISRPAPPERIERKMLESFASPPFLRLLFDSYDPDLPKGS